MFYNFIICCIPLKKIKYKNKNAAYRFDDCRRDVLSITQASWLFTTSRVFF